MNQNITTGISTFSLEPGESATFYASSDAAGKVTPDFGGAVLTITGGSATKVGPYSQRMGMSVRLDSGSISAIRDGGAGDLTAADVNALQLAPAGPLAMAMQQAYAAASAGNVFDLPVMSAPPTVTTPGVAPSPVRVVDLAAAGGSAFYTLCGATGPGYVYSSPFFVRVRGARTSAAMDQTATSGYTVDFVTDAPSFRVDLTGTVPRPIYFAVGTPAMSGMQIAIDGGTDRAVYTDPMTIDWGGVRKLRGYRFFFDTDQGIGKIHVGEDDTFYAPNPPALRILDIGDSFIADTLSPSGVGAFFGLPNALRQISGCNVIGQGIGSSGYINGNVLGNAWRVEDAAACAAHLTRIHLGINDVGQSQSAIKAAALSAIGALKAASPTMRLQVFGPHSGNRNLSAGLLAVEAGIAEAVSAFADSSVRFIPTVTGSASVSVEISGARDTDTSSGAAGNSRYMTGNDGTHPSNAGALYIARRRHQASIADALAAGW